MLVDTQQSQQHRPTASERTEPRRSHAAFYCYSVKLCSLHCVAGNSPVTNYKTNFVSSLTKITVVLNLKRERSQYLVSLIVSVRTNLSVVVM